MAFTGPDINTYTIPEVQLGDTFNFWREITNTNAYKLNKLRIYDAADSASIGVTYGTDGVLTNSLPPTVTTEHTFASLVRFTSGLSANAVYASSGSTFAAGVWIAGGVTASALYASTGSTFAARVWITGGVTASALYASTGSTFGGGVWIGGGLSELSAGLTASAVYASRGSTFAGDLRVGSDAVGATLGVCGGIMLHSASPLRFGVTTSNRWVAFQAPNSVAANFTWTLPSVDGTVGQVLCTTSGVLGWTTLILPGTTGSSTQIQYKNNVGFSASSALTLTAGGLSASAVYASRGSTFGAGVWITGGVTASAVYASTGSTFAGDLTVGLNSVGATLGVCGGIMLHSASPLRFGDATSGRWVAFRGPSAAVANLTWTLPSVDGAAGQVLCTNGGCSLGWTPLPYGLSVTGQLGEILIKSSTGGVTTSAMKFLDDALVYPKNNILIAHADVYSWNANTTCNIISIGCNAASNMINSCYNTTIGRYSMVGVSGSCCDNSVGYFSMYREFAIPNSGGFGNNAVGHNALSYIVAPSENNVIGYTNLSGSKNTAKKQNNAIANGNAAQFPAMTGNTGCGNNTINSDFRDGEGYCNNSIVFNGQGSIFRGFSGANHNNLGGNTIALNLCGNDNISIVGGYLGTAYSYGKNVNNNISIGSCNFDSIVNSCNNISIAHCGSSNSLFGSFNIGIQCGSMDGVTGSFNNGIGYGALAGVSGSFNNSIGESSMLRCGNGNIGGGRFLFSNATGNCNVGVGDSVMYGATGSCNVIVGLDTLRCGYGSCNIAFSNNSMRGATGSCNIAIGENFECVCACRSIAIGFDNGRGIISQFVRSTNNILIGYQNMIYGLSSPSGDCNILIGYQSLAGVGGGCNTSIGSLGGGNICCNTAVGFQTMAGSDNACNNTAVGMSALTYNCGCMNVGVGSGTNHSKGCCNTAVGFNSGFSAGTFCNVTAIGCCSSFYASNTIKLGSISSNLVITGSIINNSDCRNKTDVRPTIWGLDFINALRPVDYRWDHRSDYADGTPDGSKKGTRFHSGLLAQEVQAAASATGEDFAGVIHWSYNGISQGPEEFGLKYDYFYAPLIRAVQELSVRTKQLEAQWR